jgi:hypothetical protein
MKIMQDISITNPDIDKYISVIEKTITNNNPKGY